MTAPPCARGCIVRGEHLDECDTTGCRGCLPRPAEFGLLCAWDWQRLNGDVVEAAALVRHLRDDVADPEAASGSTPATDGPRAYRDPSEGSVLSPAIGAADELHAMLAELADRILDGHHRVHLNPSHPGRLDPPPEAGVWRSLSVLKRDPDTDDTYVVPSRVVGIRDATATERLVTWLLPLLPWVAQHEWVVDVRRDLATLVRATVARWPLEEDPRGKHVQAPCPRCHALSLHRTPPTPARPIEQVVCTNPECARILTEDEWHAARDAAEVATGRTIR